MKRLMAVIVTLVSACEPGTLSTPSIIVIPPMDQGPETDAAPEPEPNPEPMPDGEPAPMPEPEPGPMPEPMPEAEPDPMPEAEPEGEPDPNPDPAPEGEPEPRDPCAEVDCGPNGRCVDGACRCDPGFEPIGDVCRAIDPCRDVQCGANARCDAGACVCLPGFVDDGGACVPEPMTPLELRTEADVCAHWAREYQFTEGPDWAGGDGQCAAGAVPAAAQDNAIRRTNLYRWQAGLAPVAVDAARLDTQQACATVLAAIRRLSHRLTDDMPCYSAAAAQGAGSSNLSGGGGLAQSVDLYIRDPGAGNAELGHRRWILNPAMAETAFGYKNGFGCMYAFSNSARHAIEFVAWPTPGWLPTRAAAGRFHVAFYTLRPGPDFRIEAALNDAPLAEVESWPLNTGFGRSRAAYGYAPPGGSVDAIWRAGNTLTVALRGLIDHDDIVFTTRFTGCR